MNRNDNYSVLKNTVALEKKNSRINNGLRKKGEVEDLNSSPTSEI